MTLPESASPNSTLVVPLARARDGTPISLPDGGFAWRVRRHTGGRPRLHLDGSKQPMLLSLSYTMADLDDILPPGSYKLDLVDRSGMALGLTIDVEIGTLRNAPPGESQDLDDGPVALTAGAGDVRYLLEANVRSTQLAFQHNQRTLEAGLRMADTLREGIQTLAETQADWIKALVASRGYFRNGAMPPLAALPAQTQPEQDGDDDNELEAAPNDRLMEFGLGVVTLVNNLFAKLGSPAAAKSAAPTKVDAPMKFDLRSMFDWRHAAKQGELGRSSLGAAEPRGTRQIRPVVDRSNPASRSRTAHV